MKVYVCYFSIPHEGYTLPIAVFDTEGKAAEWMNKNGDDADYEELEVE